MDRCTDIQTNKNFCEREYDFGNLYVLKQVKTTKPSKKDFFATVTFSCSTMKFRIEIAIHINFQTSIIYISAEQVLILLDIDSYIPPAENKIDITTSYKTFVSKNKDKECI